MIFPRVRQDLAPNSHRAMAEQRRGFCPFVEVPQDFAHVGVLHQVHDRCLPAGHENTGILVQSLLDHRAQCADLVHRGIMRKECLGAA